MDEADESIVADRGVVGVAVQADDCAVGRRAFLGMG